MPFIKFLGSKIPQIKNVVGTNMCMIGVNIDQRTSTLKIFSVIDNLLKGAAGQAVQNMNIMMGFDEMEGLKLNGFF
jgi:N-acetyl-gamma-glutamyl-phosphate reductase